MFTRLGSNSSLFDQGQNITSLSSVDTFDYNNNYNVNLNGHSSFNSAINGLESNAQEQLFNDNGYSFTSGYGLINAAAAVAKAAGQTTFADVPNLGGNNWGADLVKAPEAWAKGYTGKGVVVAVLDTGVDFNHDDLKDNIWTNPKEIAGNGKDDDGDGLVDDVHGWNFVDNNNDVSDKFGHGTHVSGTIAAEKNDFGVTGIAYDAKIMPVKVLGDDGSGSYTSISNGIHYAADHGANVINLSLGGGSADSTLEKAIEYASTKGVIVVMAAGNESGLQPGYPARYADKSGIAVGAVDKNNQMADFSNKAGVNPLTYVTAPGVNVYSTIPGNKYASYSGTSMAAPHVAGVVALMLSANHNLTDAQVRQIVAETAVHDTQMPNFGLSNFATNSSATTSNFSVRDYHDGSYGSQNQLDDSNTVQFSGFSVSSTLNNYVNCSQFSSYQTLLNNLNYSITDSDDTTVSENILKQRKEMLEENFRMVS